MTDIAGPVRRELTETTQPQSAHAASATPPQRHARRVTVSPRRTDARPCGNDWTSLRKSQPRTQQTQSYCSQKAARRACRRDSPPYYRLLFALSPLDDAALNDLLETVWRGCRRSDALP